MRLRAMLRLKSAEENVRRRFAASRFVVTQFAVTLGVVTALLAADVQTARAHIVTEKPWHPVAAAYRSMMFLGDLTPVPWGKIGRAFEKPHPAAVSAVPARIKLEARGKPNRDGSMILRAIAAKDRQQLYATTTRATSHIIRAHLAAAEQALDQPGTALKKVSIARSVYRAFEWFVAQADPVGAKRIGRAWLILTSSVGTKGLLGAGQAAANKPRFGKARKTIDHYLRQNFEPEHFKARKQLTPLPEQMVLRDGEAALLRKIAPWMPPGSDINDQNPLPLLVLNFEERGIDETKLPQVAFGDMLFDSPELFGPVARKLGISCSTCHNRSDINQRFFIPGVSHQPGAADVDGGFFNPHFNDHRADSLDIPSLRGIRFTAPYGRDGRVQGLRDFTRNVIVSEFGGQEPTPFMLDALLAYMLEFDFLPNSKIDQMGRLKKQASESAKRGAVLFNTPFVGMAGKSCATCHIPSANFVDKRQHNIGSDGKQYQNSRGGAFDTPTLLGTRYTAPYFHDGSLPTLARVVGWFDKTFKLKLKAQQKSDLTAYLETVGGADEPYQAFAGKDTPFRLGFDELMTFVTTLDVLLPKRDARHTELLLRTITQDLRADASGMVNLAAKNKAYELSTRLGVILDAVVKKDWEEAKREWAAFKKTKEKYDTSLF